MRNLWYGTLIVLLFTNCGGNDNTKSNKLDTSLPVYKGNLIGHGGKGSRDIPIYNEQWQLLDYNVGDTVQVIYDAWKLELLDIHGWEDNWYSKAILSEDKYSQTIEDMIITEKQIQYEPVNTSAR